MQYKKAMITILPLYMFAYQYLVSPKEQCSPDEMPHFAALQLGLHCLYESLVYKGLSGQMDYPVLTPKVNFPTQYTYELQYLCLIYRFFYLWVPMLVMTFSLTGQVPSHELGFFFMYPLFSTELI